MRNIISRIEARLSSKLVNKLILLFTLIIVSIVVLITLISYRIMGNESFNNIIASNTNNLNLVNKNFENYFSDISQSTFPSSNFDKVMNAVDNESTDYLQSSYLEDYIRSLIYLRKDIYSVYLYIINEKKTYYIARTDNDLVVRTSYGNEITSQDWYKKLILNPENTCFQSIFSIQDKSDAINNDNKFIAFHRVLRNISNKQPRAVITIYFNSIKRDDILSDIPIESGEHTLLLNTNNEMFYSDNKKVLSDIQLSNFIKGIDKTKNKGYFYYKIKDMKYLIVYDISKLDGWKLIKLIPFNEINKVAQINRNISIIISLIFLFISVILVAITSSSITKPLKKLSMNMNIFGKGDFDIQVDIKGKDEIAQLTKQFNVMVTKINDLINEQYKMKLIQKNAILKALEAELNPHFLYNALQAISTKALKSGSEDISVMVDALALTFRYCINGEEIVKIRDEISHIENYLIIQKARYGNRLQVKYELEESVLDFKVPKISIQGLVENSIKHALEKSSSVCTILIKVTTEGDSAKIIVKDDGKGIKEEELNEIIQSINSEWTDGEYKNIGLKNLNTRLKLIFGEKSEIKIKSNELGTEIAFIIPKEE